ncbi:MAG: YHS domain-containing protein [Nitrospirae bacterium]|nr:YHS domain-containing protein [Nitrospirota bacterium]
MLKKMTVVVVAVVGVIGVNGLSFSALSGEERRLEKSYLQTAHAEHEKEAGAEKAKASPEGNKAEEAGNSICPVSGEGIDEKTKVTYEYKGKIYAFCCTDCLEEFKKDPEKYIEKMEKGRSNIGSQEQAPEKGHHSH